MTDYLKIGTSLSILFMLTKEFIKIICADRQQLPFSSEHHKVMDEMFVGAGPVSKMTNSTGGLR